MTRALDQAEALIADGARFRRADAPGIALDKLRQSSILLFRAREELDRSTVLDLRAQSERPLNDSFPRRVRDATIALCEAVETREYMAGRSDPESAARWSRRVDRARSRVEQTVRDELRRGGRP
jgi:hypothetical protein